MTVGVSIFLFAVGAVLRYAVTDNLDGVDLQMVGVILMVAGAVGLLISLFLMASRRTVGRGYDDGYVEERPVYRDRV